jgi:nucleoid-associated protein YgaU
VRRRGARALLAVLALLGAASTSNGLHEVRPGETLAAIAHETLGDAALWPALYRANRDQIRDPARLYPGQKLSIPTLSPAQREAARRESRVRRVQ